MRAIQQHQSNAQYKLRLYDTLEFGIILNFICLLVIFTTVYGKRQNFIQELTIWNTLLVFSVIFVVLEAPYFFLFIVKIINRKIYSIICILFFILSILGVVNYFRYHVTMLLQDLPNLNYFSVMIGDAYGNPYSAIFGRVEVVYLFLIFASSLLTVSWTPYFRLRRLLSKTIIYCLMAVWGYLFGISNANNVEYIWVVIFVILLFVFAFNYKNERKMMLNFQKDEKNT